MTDPNLPTTTSWVPTSSQVDATLRHVYTSAASVFTVLSIFAILPADQVKPAIETLQHIGDDIKSLMGHLSALWVILGPVAIAFIAKAAAFSASLKSQLKSIAANPAVKIEGKIVVPPDVAAAVPNPLVVSH